MVSHRASPFEGFVSRLHGVRGSRQRLRAQCPAHGSRSLTLAVSEGRDGRVLVKCFAGCEPAEIARAVGLELSDLFPPRDREELRKRGAIQRRFQREPRQTLARALDAERARVRARLREELGFDRPWRSGDENDARRRVARAFGIMEKPAVVPPFAWECPPNDEDPVWPALYMRALEEEVRRRWQALHPDAVAWATDPAGAGLDDRICAEQLAREWQRGLCR